ncbi:MAG: L-threonylcarbamoyladenylate synthase [Pseudomonadales bacterium]|jgi:tRNA threonylcarbamoyl adenosine modification protein (Sua5/YciO/YrdC/YwlC family)|nr:L-threonylcarbamoyladenylate synthase [Pseudomonadales bacterium]
MAQFFSIHPEDPQGRLVHQAVEILRGGGVLVYPTDSAYAIACRLENKEGMERIRRVRQVDKDHNFTLVCPDLSVLANYARVDNTVFRLLKAHTPGPFTFILPATREVPRRLMHPKRRTIGLRVPENPIARALLEELGEPLMSCTLILPGRELPETEPWEIRETLEHQVDLVIDGGFCGLEPTTVIDFTGPEPELVRQGRGDATAMLAA